MSSLIDFSMGFIIPFHFHIGMRSILVDYMPHVGVTNPKTQANLLYALGAMTLLTAFGLTKLNLGDVGISGAIKSFWIKKARKEERA